ncbi:MAG: hypothetical protein ABI905_11035 [Betaproteobacteria bacterium]
MHPGTDESRLAALTAIFKVMARWAPQARHDLVGACSPISLDLSLLGVKSRRAPLTSEDVDAFVERGKKNVKNTVQEIDTVMLLQRQERTHEISVCDMLEKMARSTRTAFAGVDWSPPEEPATLGAESEYDLTITIWAVLMALLDRHGANQQLRLFAQRVGGEDGSGDKGNGGGGGKGDLVMDFSVSPASGESWAGATADAGAQRISIDEVHHLANHLGFAFSRREGGIELRREFATAA